MCYPDVDLSPQVNLQPMSQGPPIPAHHLSGLPGVASSHPKAQCGLLLPKAKTSLSCATSEAEGKGRTPLWSRLDSQPYPPPGSWPGILPFQCEI